MLDMMQPNTFFKAIVFMDVNLIEVEDDVKPGDVEDDVKLTVFKVGVKSVDVEIDIREQFISK